MTYSIASLTHKGLVAATALVALFHPAGSTALPHNPHTDWFKNARYGVFMHFLPGDAKGLERVRDFDVASLARQLESAGARYIVLTLGQNSGYMNSPNPVYDRITGYKAGERCSTRDLPLDLYRALRPKGIKLMLYLPCQTPNRDGRAQKAFGLPHGPRDQPITIEFARRWSQVIYEWSSRYKDKVAGWWFDGGYQHIRFNDDIARIYSDAVKRGNPRAIVTFNPGVRLIRWTEAEDYTAGELNEPFATVPAGRWVEGSQWHALTYLGSRWSARDTRYAEDRWAAWAVKVVSKGGVLTLDAGPNWDPDAGPIGAISDAQMAQLRRVKAAVGSTPVSASASRSGIGATGRVERGSMAGYLLVPNDRVEQTYNAGFSMYVAAWPLLEEYPGQRFQTGLFGTWMHPQYDSRPTERLYTDIEGGLGWWRDTRFATETPKFIMGGVALNFRAWANGPGAGKGRDWDQPKGKYGVAQLSPWVLWPPDGLNLKQGTCGQLFGYGYLPLPLTEAKATTAGKNVPTGNHCWTLFLNTGNFKGPVAFFTPYFWSRVTVEKPNLAGMFLDTRPSQPNRALQMETQYVPSVQAVDARGDTYARIAPTSFPRGPKGNSVVVHRVTSYSKKALWDAVEAWFSGGPPADGATDPAGASVHTFPGRGRATWRIYTRSVPRDERVPLAWSSFATPMAPDPSTFGYRWNNELVTKRDTKDGPLVTLPHYYRLVRKDGKKPQWVVVAPEDVPAETGLADVRFSRPAGRASKPYITPDAPGSCWKKPGPVAGPFQAHPGDGSVVTYYWYRFADQPAVLNADLTHDEREALQKRVEMLHRHWTKNRTYLTPPAIGELADIEPALLVSPPRGLEVGYVPIATRQEAE